MSRASQKHEREVQRRVMALHREMRCEYEQGGAHPVLLASVGAVTVRVLLGRSPTDEDKAAVLAVASARRQFRAKGVAL